MNPELDPMPACVAEDAPAEGRCAVNVSEDKMTARDSQAKEYVPEGEDLGDSEMDEVAQVADLESEMIEPSDEMLTEEDELDLEISLEDLEEEALDDIVDDHETIIVEKLDRSRSRADVDGIAADDTVSLYLKQMGQVALLTAAEEVMLARQIEEGEAARAKLKRAAQLSPEVRAELNEMVCLGECARTRLVEANTRLVVSVAKKYIGQGVPLLDLIQEGNIGLMKAVEKFDYHRGYKFSTYATWWIRQGITRALAQQSRLIRLPVHAGDQIRRIYRVIEQFEQDEGRRPSPEEIAEQTGIELVKVERLMRISRYPVSLERPVGDDGDTEFGDFIEDEEAPAPADMAYRQLLREALEEVMTALTARETRILWLRFGLNDGRAHTLEEVGEKFGLTRERIRQIEHQALDRLRHPYRSQQLRDYLR